jgi:transposase InsO family protein
MPMLEPMCGCDALATGLVGKAIGNLFGKMIAGKPTDIPFTATPINLLAVVTIPGRAKPNTCPFRKPYPPADSQRRVESAMIETDGGVHKTTVRDFPRLLAVARTAVSGESRSAPSAECPAPQNSEAAAVFRRRSGAVFLDLLVLSECLEGARDCSAGDGHPLASRGLACVVALEIQEPRRAPEDRHRIVRDLIRQMCRDNPLWGAPRIHGELLKLGYDIAQSTVSKYCVRRRGPPSQGWKTFLQNHADGIASIDLFVVPSIIFECLYVFVVLGHRRRQIVWFAVTRHPTAEWLSRQITEAFPWDAAPAILVRDNDKAFGTVFRRRVVAMGIRDHPVTPRSPWQNGYVERLIGSVRRECLDHMIIFGETHLRRAMAAYADYYNSACTHLSYLLTPNF